MNSSKLYKCILFDLDGVLLDTEKIYMNLMVNYNIEIGINADKEYYIKNLLGRTQKEINECYCKDFEFVFNPERYWNALLNIREEYIKNNNIDLKPGVLELIKYLKDEKYIIGIVTSNSKALTEELLNKSKLKLSNFDIVVSREHVSRTKPSPELYLKALNLLNLDKCDVLAIEDSKVGIESALSADIDVINVMDIDIIPASIMNKCVFCCENAKEIIEYLKEKRN